MKATALFLAAAISAAPTAYASDPTAFDNEAPVVLINTFEVVPGREAECLAAWDRAADFLSKKTGLLSTRLHRTIDPTARFGLINVARWRSAKDFRAAVGDPEFRAIAYTDACRGAPALYEIVRSRSWEEHR